jgi:uncharacterized protein (TIGR03437 family)
MRIAAHGRANLLARTAGIAALCLGLVLAQATPPNTYVIQTLAGSSAAGNGGPALTAAFAQLEGIALDSSGNSYIADTGDHRVRVISADGRVSTIAGTGIPGYSGDGGPAHQAQLREPYGLALDRLGNLYVADLGNRCVRRISPGGIINSVAGGGSSTSLRVNDGATAVLPALQAPRNVALGEDGSLYISDFGANRLYVVNRDGVAAILAGSGKAGFNGDHRQGIETDLNGPAALLPMPDGSLVFADSGNRRVRRIHRGVVTTVFSGAAGYPLYSPTGLAVDAGGRILIADGRAEIMLRISAGGAPMQPLPAGGRAVAVDVRGNVLCAGGGMVRQIAPSGAVTVVAGLGKYGFGGDGGAADLARMYRPEAVAVDLSGNIYIADTGNHRVRRVTPAGFISTVAGTGDAGYGGDGGPAPAARLNGPRGVACDSLGNLYVADTGNHRIRKVSPTGLITTLAGVDSPLAVAVSPAGALYLASAGSRLVRRIDPWGTISTVAGPPAIEQPVGLALDSSGNLYVTDAAPGRVRRILAGGAVETFGGFVLASPTGIATQPGGDLIVAETGLHRLVRLRRSGELEVIAGNGSAGFDGDGGPAPEARLNYPTGLAMDSSGNILVADAGNHRVRRLAPVIAAAVEEQPRLRVLNAASFRPGPVAPGELVTILGGRLCENDAAAFFDTTRALILYSSATQVNLQVPLEVAGKKTARLEIRCGPEAAASENVQVAPTAPGLFTMEQGAGQALVIHEDGSRNSLVNPAPRGSVVTLVATGEGLSGADLPLFVRITGEEAPLLSARAAPGLPGVVLLEVRIPVSWTPSGNQAVELQAGSMVSQPGVTLALR